METFTELGKAIFVGSETTSYDTLSAILGADLSWGKETVSEEKLMDYDILFFEKKSFYKYHKWLEEIVSRKKCSIYLINDQLEITQEEIQKFRSYSIRDAFYLPSQQKQLTKTLQLLNKAKQKRKEDVKLQYHIKPQLAKRIFDIVMSSFALLFLSPVILITLIAIKMTSKGPVFYASKRVGNGYRIFDFYKFRTMRVDADKMIDKMQKLNQYAGSEVTKEQVLHNQLCAFCQEKGECQEKLYNDQVVVCEKAFMESQNNSQSKAFLKVKNDPRITPIGHFLRKSSIDELPQLINVLKGDMSLVGNRPLPLYEAENLTTDHGSERFLAPAGLTGLWQVMKRGQGSMSAQERKDLDNEYARNQSFFGDIKLILMTVPALFQKEDV